MDCGSSDNDSATGTTGYHPQGRGQPAYRDCQPKYHNYPHVSPKMDRRIATQIPDMTWVIRVGMARLQAESQINDTMDEQRQYSGQEGGTFQSAKWHPTGFMIL